MNKVNRKAVNYSDNLLDSYMSFNEVGTWTVSAGTGSGIHSTDYVFEGERALKIQNTAPTTDITVTNAIQNTVIDLKIGTCYLSFYMLRLSTSRTYEGNVKIFKNAVLLDTQEWSLLETENGEWYRFVSDQSYTLVETDVITFTFTITGIVGGTGTSDVYIDGMMLHNSSRLDFAPPLYNQPPPDVINIDDLKNVGGWGVYQDAETTPATLTFNATPSKMQIDGGASASNSDYLPLEIRGTSELWDVVNDKILPIDIGDSYTVRFDFEVTGETASPTDIIVQLDIGGGASPTNVILNRYAGTGKSTPYYVSIGFPYYTLTDFVTNGGQIFISTDTGSITVGARRIFISRISNGLIV